MNVTNSTIPFPSRWDENNVGATDFYKKCYPYAEKTEDFYAMADVSAFFIVFGIIVFAFIIFVNVWLLCYYKNYILKRQCVKYYLGMVIGSLLITFDTYFLEVRILLFFFFF